MTAVQMNPYVTFQDRTREAMACYRDVFGGELSMDTCASMGMSGTRRTTTASRTRSW